MLHTEKSRESCSSDSDCYQIKCVLEEFVARLDDRDEGMARCTAAAATQRNTVIRAPNRLQVCSWDPLTCWNFSSGSMADATISVTPRWNTRMYGLACAKKNAGSSVLNDQQCLSGKCKGAIAAVTGSRSRLLHMHGRDRGMLHFEKSRGRAAARTPIATTKMCAGGVCCILNDGGTGWPTARSALAATLEYSAPNVHKLRRVCIWDPVDGYFHLHGRCDDCDLVGIRSEWMDCYARRRMLELACSNDQCLSGLCAQNNYCCDCDAATADESGECCSFCTGQRNLQRARRTATCPSGQCLNDTYVGGSPVSSGQSPAGNNNSSAGKNNSSACSSTKLLAAGGDNITYYGDYTIHTFTSNGTFQVTHAGLTSVELLVVGGGGGRDNRHGGGGGGQVQYTDARAVTTRSYTVTVGAGGGAAASSNSCESAQVPGGNSAFDDLVSIGGGSGTCAWW